MTIGTRVPCWSQVAALTTAWRKAVRARAELVEHGRKALGGE